MQSAFDPDAAQKLQQAQEDGDLDQMESPLWWLSKREDGTQILHATLSDPSAYMGLQFAPDVSLVSVQQLLRIRDVTDACHKLHGLAS